MKRARPLLGTIVEIAAGGDDDAASRPIDAAFAAIETIHHLMSFHEADSDVSRINSAAPEQVIDIDPHTYRVLEFAQKLSELSAGIFDITMASVLIGHGFLPSPPVSRPADATANHTDLVLMPHNQVRWRRAGCIDLGGIAKGYAVDCAIETLRAHGKTAAVVNAGGDLRCLAEPQPIHLRHPADPRRLMPLGWLTDGAFATSAGYFSGIGSGDEQIDPLVDPRLRSCARWDASVSVAAANCMTADALTKVVRLAPEAAPGILEHFKAQAIIIDQLGSRGCGHAWLLQDMANDSNATAVRSR
jgi:thiamine biosynthesis lipoprotein